MKKCISTAFLGILFAAVMSIAASADESGNCGAPTNEGGEASVTWTLDDTGTLTISGTGDMDDYTFTVPWGTGIRTVVINRGVTRIGRGAFYNCDSLTSITIPDSVKSIGNSALSCCDSLTSITLPDSVTSIGVGAFHESDSLRNVTLSNGITTINNNTFKYCSHLESIIIPDGVTSIGEDAFKECESLQA